MNRRSSKIFQSAVAVAVAIAFCESTAAAQRGQQARSDTAVHQLDTIVVTPDRSASTIRTSTVAVSAIPGSWIRALPLRSVGSALAVAPGIAVLDVGSVGGNPRVIARGFYGGGETDYVSAQIDGVPIAALGSGAVDWTMLSPWAINRLELVRGATSYIHGDAAVGGTLNALIPVSPSDLSWRVAYGSYAIGDAALRAGRSIGSSVAEIAADYRSSNGYRVEDYLASSNVHAKFERYGSASSVGGFILLHARKTDDPGPLLTTDPDRRAQNPFFRLDHGAERVDRAGVDGARLIGPAKISGYVVGEYATARAVKTLPLSTDFADTKLRRTSAPRVLTSGQVEIGDDKAGFGRVVAGIDASAGKLTSRYADVVSGDLSAYASANGEAGPSSPPSKASRSSLAGFANWQLRPIDPLRFTLGVRGDRISDKFVPASGSGGNTELKTHDALSPHVGVNFELPASRRATTNLFVAAGRAFKSPTLDQLFDDRTIPIPVPPFSATVSNPDLVPQRGTSLEAGLYQSWKIGDGMRIDWSGALYEEKMREELDFDITTFRYINIGRSRHRGGELGLTAESAGKWFAFLNYARQSVIAQNGQFEGKQLKAIPRDVASAGANATLWRGFTAGLIATSLSGAFVDDDNAVPLSGFTRIDARLGIPFGPARVTVDLQNALNRRYDVTGFPDPGGSAAIYRYPAAGRVLVVGLESR
ncbi:MAG TPA: TonB-dependent receptor [Gemmatimonadaceae bacterium]|nr:TonB-dependent receptor [Gemmatimonadaceae bacterium]